MPVCLNLLLFIHMRLAAHARGLTSGLACSFLQRLLMLSGWSLEWDVHFLGRMAETTEHDATGQPVCLKIKVR